MQKEVSNQILVKPIMSKQKTSMHRVLGFSYKVEM